MGLDSRREMDNGGRCEASCCEMEASQRFDFGAGGVLRTCEEHGPCACGMWIVGEHDTDTDPEEVMGYTATHSRVLCYCDQPGTLRFTEPRWGEGAPDDGAEWHAAVGQL